MVRSVQICAYSSIEDNDDTQYIEYDLVEIIRDRTDLDKLVKRFDTWTDSAFPVVFISDRTNHDTLYERGNPDNGGTWYDSRI